MVLAGFLVSLLQRGSHISCNEALVCHALRLSLVVQRGSHPISIEGLTVQEIRLSLYVHRKVKSELKKNLLRECFYPR